MAQRSVSRRYPVSAVLAVGGASLLLAFNLVVGFLFMALVPPMIPVYVCVLFAGGCLVESTLRYAQKVSIVAPTAMLDVGSNDEEVQGRGAPAPARAP